MTDEQIVPRLPGVDPATLDDEGRELDRVLRDSIGKYLTGFVSEASNGALIGPFPGIQHFPDIGGPAWDLFLALAGSTVLDAGVREVVILSVGAVTTAQYELYSHEVRARAAGLSDTKIRLITSRQRPADLTDDEAVAYDVTAVLLQGRRVPNTLYAQAVAALGERGVAEIAYLAGCYQLISNVLNLFDVAAPAAPS